MFGFELISRLTDLFRSYGGTQKYEVVFFDRETGAYFRSSGVSPYVFVSSEGSSSTVIEIKAMSDV